MYTLIAVWSAPNEEDREAFEEHYKEEHAPLAAAVPNLEKIITTRTADGLSGEDPGFYRVAEMVFESKAALREAQDSEAWAAVRADGREMRVRFGVTLEVGMGERNVGVSD